MSIEQNNRIIALEAAVTLLAEKLNRLEQYIAIEHAPDVEPEPERRGPGRPRKNPTLTLPTSQ